MEFTINKKELLDKVKELKTILTNKPILPVLESIKIMVREDSISSTNTISLVATNLEQSLSLKISNENLFNITKKGTSLIPCDILLKLLEKINVDKVTIKQIDDTNIQVITEKSIYDLEVIESESFPNITYENVIGVGLTINREKFLAGLEKIDYAKSKDSSKDILTSIQVEIENNRMILCANDGYRLAEIQLNLSKECENQQFLLPKESVKHLLKLLAKYKNDYIYLLKKDNILHIQINGTTFQTRLVEGQYPDYKRILPKEFEKIVAVNREEIINAVETLTCISKEAPVDIIYSKKENTLKVIMQGIKNKGTENIKGFSLISESNEKEQIHVRLKTEYFLQALKTFSSKMVYLKLNEELRPIILGSSIPSELITCLIMPVRIND